MHLPVLKVVTTQQGHLTDEVFRPLCILFVLHKVDTEDDARHQCEEDDGRDHAVNMLLPGRIDNRADGELEELTDDQRGEGDEDGVYGEEVECTEEEVELKCCQTVTCCTDGRHQ